MQGNFVGLSNQNCVMWESEGMNGKNDRFKNCLKDSRINKLV